MTMTLGKEIREAFLEKGMTQAELARKSGINIGTMKDYVNDYCCPSFGKIKKIEKTLGVQFKQYPKEKRKEAIDKKKIKIIGENIKYIIHTKGMTQIELSEVTNISKPVICKIIRGEKDSIKESFLEKISDALKVSIEELMSPSYISDKEKELLEEKLKSLPKEERERLANWLLELD